MSERENIDISRVIGLIMENPQIVEQISNLARSSEAPAPKEDIKEEKNEDKQADSRLTQAAFSPAHAPLSGGERTQLLSALKPYLSEERARAIDSMISIAGIINMMKAR